MPPAGTLRQQSNYQQYKAEWVEPDIGENDAVFELYPEESIADWHKKRGLWIE